jgi:hypothetical protein
MSIWTGFEHIRLVVVDALRQAAGTSLNDTPYFRQLPLQTVTFVNEKGLPINFNSDGGYDEGFDVFLLAGQSNSVGAGDSNDGFLDYTNPNILQYPSNGVYEKKIIVAQEPLTHKVSAASSKIGMHLTFAKNYHKVTGRSVLLLPCAEGSTGFKNNRWNPGNDLYEYSINSILEVLNLNSNNSLKAILWHQGELDAGSTEDIAAFPSRLDAMITGFRTRLNSPNLPFILGELQPTYLAVTPPAMAINNHLKNTPQRISNTFCVSSRGLTGNNGEEIHFNAPSLRIFGKRYFDAYYGLYAATTIPAKVRSVIIGVVTATTMDLAWISDSAVTWEVAYTTNNIRLVVISRTPSITLTNLVSSTTYTIEIAAINKNGSSAITSITATTAGAPNVVTNVVSTSLGTSSSITWQSVNATSWRISGSGGINTQIVTIPSVILTGLVTNTAYTINIVAINSGGESAPVVFTFTTLASDSSIPPATLQYLFEGTFANTGTNTTQPTNTGVTIVTDATRGQVALFATAIGQRRYLTAGIPIPNSFTISAWVNATGRDINNYPIIAGYTFDPPPQLNANFTLSAYEKLTFGARDENYNAVADTVNLALNSWVHIAIVKNLGAVKLYKNGVSVGNGTTTFTGSENLYIGDYTNNSSSQFCWIGLMDKVQIWNTTLSDAQILAIFNQG